MQKHLKKIARLAPVLDIKKTRVDAEAVALAAILREKSKLESELMAWQQKYLNGVTRLNAERESVERPMLLALEAAVDHARETLFVFFQRLKEVDLAEQAQVMRVNMVQRELSAVEKLQETHRERFKKELSRNEQKGHDEIALRRFLNSR